MSVGGIKIGALAAFGCQPALDPQAVRFRPLRAPHVCLRDDRGQPVVFVAATQHRWMSIASTRAGSPGRHVPRKKSGCFLLCSLEWSRVLHDSGLSFEHNSALTRQRPRFVATRNKLQASNEYKPAW